MSEQTLTRADLIEAVHERTGLERSQARDLVMAFMDQISGTVTAGEDVKLSGFGTFVVREKNERIGRNPKTGEEVPIAPRRVMTFRPSQLMKARVQKSGSARSKAARK